VKKQKLSCLTHCLERAVGSSDSVLEDLRKLSEIFSTCSGSFRLLGMQSFNYNYNSKSTVTHNQEDAIFISLWKPES